MTSPPSQDVTQLLLAWSDGDKGALERLVPLVYRELHKLSWLYMAGERPQHTLQLSALHMTGIDESKIDFIHLRSGEVRLARLNEALVVREDKASELVALDDALKASAAIDPRRSQLCGIALFRWAERGGNGRGVESVIQNNVARMESGLSLALSRAEQSRQKAVTGDMCPSCEPDRGLLESIAKLPDYDP